MDRLCRPYLRFGSASVILLAVDGSTVLAVDGSTVLAVLQQQSLALQLRHETPRAVLWYYLLHKCHQSSVVPTMVHHPHAAAAAFCGDDCCW
jgi:hypothetical protein